MSRDDLRALLYLTGVVALGTLIAKMVWWGVLDLLVP